MGGGGGGGGPMAMYTNDCTIAVVLEFISLHYISFLMGDVVSCIFVH